MPAIGRYDVISELGSGGFGKVYRANDPVIRRGVAIKILTAATDPGVVQRFRNEAGATASLSHRNIVAIHDCGEHEGRPYLVMELLDGVNLAGLINRNSGIHIQDRVSLLLQTAEGLLYAHERCILHRDIKPSNIMVLSDGSAKILDFGIARIMDTDRTRLTMPGTLLGTVEYMTPEQLAGSDADARSDVYALGLVGYELLSGRQPFRGESLARTFELIAAGSPPPLRQANPECPEPLERIVHQAMAKDPAQRYQTMQEFVWDLAHIEAGLRRDRAAALAHEAEHLAAEGGAAAAAKTLAKALRLDPLSGKAQALRHAICLRTGDGQELFAAQSPEDVLRERVLAEVEKRTSEHLAAGRLDDAARLLEGGLKRYPSDPTLIRLMTHVQRRTGEFKQAQFG